MKLNTMFTIAGVLMIFLGLAQLLAPSQWQQGQGWAIHSHQRLL